MSSCRNGGRIDEILLVWLLLLPSSVLFLAFTMTVRLFCWVRLLRWDFNSAPRCWWLLARTVYTRTLSTFVNGTSLAFSLARTRLFIWTLFFHFFIRYSFRHSKRTVLWLFAVRRQERSCPLEFHLFCLRLSPCRPHALYCSLDLWARRVGECFGNFSVSRREMVRSNYIDVTWLILCHVVVNVLSYIGRRSVARQRNPRYRIVIN